MGNNSIGITVKSPLLFQNFLFQQSLQKCAKNFNLLFVLQYKYTGTECDLYWVVFVLHPRDILHPARYLMCHKNNLEFFVRFITVIKKKKSKCICLRPRWLLPYHLLQQKQNYAYSNGASIYYCKSSQRD